MPGWGKHEKQHLEKPDKFLTNQIWNY